ncbi:helicase SEN1 [Asparagus officinalis]|nr:helicase SEN1 [Asparagus officinalis]
MGPLLETFHSYFDDKHIDSPLKLIWKRVSREMGQCAQCICQHHQAQEGYNAEYESDTIDPLLKVLQCLDEERVTDHLKEINAWLRRREYDPECHSAEVVSVMFEVLMFPTLLDDQLLVNEFQFFIEEIEKSHDVNLAGSQQYPGVYALLFFKSGRARAIGLRLAGYMGKLRTATDLEPLQPLLRKYIGFLEMEVLPAASDTSRPRVQLEQANVWLGIKSLLGFLEPPAFEDGILENYPNFLNIVLNHVSDDSFESSYAITCLRACFEMLGCKLWWRTTLSPSVMRNTLLGQCFHTRSEKSHKDIFDLFLPFLQSLEALQDGEHEKQRRHFLYFLLHQVTQSSNFSVLTRKSARKIALLIIHRGYKINPPCPPFECSHMWGPSVVNSLKDASLHFSLRQPAFDLIETIIISDVSAMISLKTKYQSVSNINSTISHLTIDDEDEVPFLHDVEEDKCCWNEFNTQNKLASQECSQWTCIPMLWFDSLVEVGPSMLPASFSKAVFWALSHVSVIMPHTSTESSLSTKDWLSSYAGEISSSFGWEIPNGSDDGGDGKESRNSVKVSSMCNTLIQTFKRFAAGFILEMEKHELHRQWTWEPKMAECLIVLLIDPDHAIRQADKVILEHMSKARDLTSQLKFLCSSASSLSAMFLGLRYALKQVEAASILANFHNLQHLFFVVNKLVNDVVKTQPPTISVEDTNTKFSSEGGFLRQPCVDNFTGTLGCSSIIVDMISWEKFSYLLSSIMWPFTLKCIAEGKEFIESKTHQMTFVRLLDTLPCIYESLFCSAPKLSWSSMLAVSGLRDFKWLSCLVDLGKSSLLVIKRRWKQCLLALMNLFKRSCSDSILCTISVIEAIISSDSAVVDSLKNEVLHVINSLSDEASCTVEVKVSKPESEPYLENRSSNVDSTFYFAKYADAERIESKKKRGDRDLIILLDDETVNMASPKLVSSSSDQSKQPILEDALPQDSRKCVLSNGPTESINSNVSRDILKPFPSRIFDAESPTSSQEEESDVLDNKSLPYEVSSSVSRNTSLIHSKDTDRKKINSMTAKDVVRSLKDSRSYCKALSSQSVKHHSSIQISSSRTRKNSLEIQKDDALIKELVCDSIDDPLERDLDNVKRPPTVLTKPITTVPKRKVIQLQMPTNNKSGKRMGTGFKRLKPPRLDDWYRPILELDYFNVVGLSPGTNEKNTTSANLKEVPLCFKSVEHYVEIFRPLVLEEFKAQLHSSYMETSPDDIFCGSLCILSVERIDDFHIVRGRPDDNESAASKGCVENDLVLLTREPLQNSAQDVHILGKVERREKSNKGQSTILVIRFYLMNGSSRLNKVMKLLTERSKWCLNRAMSITPQIREFQALSSLHDIAMLPAILNPVEHSLGHHEYRKAELSKLTRPLQDMLKSSFNDSQLEAISIAVGTQASRSSFELCLIQGPPGTGKTRTIVATVSALLSLHSTRESCSSNIWNSSSRTTVSCANPRTQIGQSAAIARAWQDAALAKQMSNEFEKSSFGQIERSPRGRVLICAQSNAAVDELVSRINEGLYGNDGKVYKPYLVRVGNAKTVHPNSQPFFIDRLVEQRLADNSRNNADLETDTNAKSSSSLRSKLEKLVDNIRHYESRRAKLDNADANSSKSSDARACNGDDMQEISDAALGAKLNILYGQKRVLCAELAAAQSREKKASEESWSLKKKIRKSILMEAEIVVTTLSGCGGDLYGVCSESASNNKFGRFSEQCLFDVVVIDEAAQALEPATLIPLQLLKSYGTKCIMVGDPKQLPATVLSSVASKFLYECSMFERLQRAGHPVVMLTEQYRMHPEISRFPSLHFYENKLLNGALVATKSASFHENACLGPYMFFDIVDGHEHHGKSSASLSLYNESEVEAAIRILTFLKSSYSSEFASRRIGIITPYRSQLSLLRSRFSIAFGPNIVSEMEFNTIDGFQGREVDILLLSTVRASDSTKSSSIGFVADVRRMNVALTRARFSLWIVGNARTLQRNLHWSSLIDNAKERNLFMSVSKPYVSIFRNAVSAVTKNSGSKSDPYWSRHPKTTGKDRSRTNSKEFPKGTSDLKDEKLHQHPKRSQNLRNDDNHSSEVALKHKDRVSTKRSHPLPSFEGERDKIQGQQNHLASADNASQKQQNCTKTGDKIVQEVQLETDSSKELIKKKKKIQIFCKSDTSSKSCQSSAMTSSEESHRLSDEASIEKAKEARKSSKHVTSSKLRQQSATAASSIGGGSEVCDVVLTKKGKERRTSFEHDKSTEIEPPAILQSEHFLLKSRS